MSAATRAYVPLERAHLEELEAGRAVPPGLSAFCVTDEMRSGRADSDEEELEFLALQQAARHAVAVGRAAIVAAVDLPAAPGSPPTSSPFLTGEDVTKREVVSFHLDDDAMAGRAHRPDQGDQDQRPTPDADDDPAVELSWFDITELPHLLRR